MNRSSFFFLLEKRFFVKTDALILALPLFFILASNFPHITAFSLPSLIPVFSLIMWLTMAATSALLLIPLAAEINRYRKSLRQEYSNLQGIDANWLKSLLIPTGVLFGICANRISSKENTRGLEVRLHGISVMENV